MPKSLQLNIADPCHENWQNMTPQEQGRFCGTCQKTVVDFTMMSDQQVLNYFLNVDHNVCGRFADDQLNKELVITKPKKRFTWAYVWNIVVATFLVTKADAQVTPKPKVPVETIEHHPQIMGKVAYVRPVNAPVVVKGNVVDETNNQPLHGASISIKDTDGGSMADITGAFSLKVDKKETTVIEVSAIGYATQTLKLDELTDLRNIQVSLKPSYKDLDAVSVNYYGYSTRRGYVTGSVSMTVSEKVLRNINDWKPAILKTDVKIYPNPVARGNSFKVSLSLKQAGAYRMEILNAAGQIMHIQPLLMQTKEQVIDLHTQTAWSAGVYWLRISSSAIKNVYQSKIVVK